VAYVVHRSTQKAIANDRKRDTCAKAMTDALAWMELPYRISRRIDDSPETVRALVERAHALQEAMLFHLSWLQVEIPEASTEYLSLISAVKDAAFAEITKPWVRPPCPHPRDSSASVIQLNRSSVESHLAHFTRIVREHLR